MVEITEDPATRKVEIPAVQAKPRCTSRVPGELRKAEGRAEGRPPGIVASGAARANVQEGPLVLPKLRRTEKDGGAEEFPEFSYSTRSFRKSNWTSCDRLGLSSHIASREEEVNFWQ
jgi:hypothetical protein